MNDYKLCEFCTISLTIVFTSVEEITVKLGDLDSPKKPHKKSCREESYHPCFNLYSTARDGEIIKTSRFTITFLLQY